VKPIREERPNESDHAPNILRESTVESDRKFWSGERPISSMQWIGLALMLATLIGVPVLAFWPNGQAPWLAKLVEVYGIFFVMLVCFSLFLLIGNRRFRRKGHGRKG
jgi:hypothetical protein